MALMARHAVGGRKGLAGDAHLRRIHALLQGLAVKQVNDFIGNTVTELVWMTLRHRFTGEDIVLA